MPAIRSRINNNNQFWFSSHGEFKYIHATIEERFFKIKWSSAGLEDGKRARGARKSEVA